MSETPELPDKVSELIKIALQDLEKVEQSPAYMVEMGHWHGPVFLDDEGSRVLSRSQGKEVCFVCLAGAVMAGTMGARKDMNLVPEHFTEEEGFAPGTADKLGWFDTIRVGEWDDITSPGPVEGDGYQQVIPDDICELLPVMPRYADHPEEFKKALARAIDVLEGYDL